MSKNQRTSRSRLEDKLYNVEEIISKRKISEQIYYRVRWQNYGPESDTWEPAQNLNTCLSVVEEYEKSLTKQAQEKKKEQKLRKKPNQTISFFNDFIDEKNKSTSNSANEDDKLLETVAKDDFAVLEKDGKKVQIKCRETRLVSLASFSLTSSSPSSSKPYPQLQNQSSDSKSCMVHSATAADVPDSKPIRSLTDQNTAKQKSSHINLALATVQRSQPAAGVVSCKPLGTCNSFVNAFSTSKTNDTGVLQPLSNPWAATDTSVDKTSDSRTTMVKTRQQHQQEARGSRADRENELSHECSSSLSQHQPNSDSLEESGSEKDTFWKDFENGKVDVFKDDLYSRVKSRNQVKKVRRVRNANLPIVSDTRTEMDTTNNNRSPSTNNLCPQPTTRKNHEQTRMAVECLHNKKTLVTSSTNDPANIRNDLSCLTSTDSNSSSGSFSALTNGAASSSNSQPIISRQCSITPSNSSAGCSPSNPLPSPPSLHPFDSAMTMSHTLTETIAKEEPKELQQINCLPTIDEAKATVMPKLSAPNQKCSTDMLSVSLPKPLCIDNLTTKKLFSPCNKRDGGETAEDQISRTSENSETRFTLFFSEGNLVSQQKPVNHCDGAVGQNSLKGIAETNLPVSEAINNTCNTLAVQTKQRISSSSLDCSDSSLAACESKLQDLCQTVSSSFTYVKPSIVTITSSAEFIEPIEKPSEHTKLSNTQPSTAIFGISVHLHHEDLVPIDVNNEPVFTVTTLSDITPILANSQTKNSRCNFNTATTSILTCARPSSSQHNSRRISFAPTVSFKPFSSPSPRTSPTMNNNTLNSRDLSGSTSTVQPSSNNGNNNREQQNNNPASGGAAMAAVVNINRAVLTERQVNLPELVERLLSNPNANLDARFGGEEATALMMSAEYGEPELALQLVQKKAPINSVDRRGESALIKACRNGHIEVVNLLLAKGANFSIRNQNLSTAMKEAKTHSRGRVFSLLQSFISRISTEFNLLINTVIKQLAVVQHALFALQIHVPAENAVLRLNFLSDEDSQNKAPNDGYLMFFATREYDELILNPLQLTGDQKLNVLLNGSSQRNLCTGGDLVYSFSQIRRGTNQLNLRFDGNFENRINQSVIFCAYKVSLFQK